MPRTGNLDGTLRKRGKNLTKNNNSNREERIIFKYPEQNHSTEKKLKMLEENLNTCTPTHIRTDCIIQLSRK